MSPFSVQMINCKARDVWNRDKARSENRDESKTYESLAFPAYHGSPLMFNSIILAYLFTWFRSWSYAEARLINTKTGQHKVF